MENNILPLKITAFGELLLRMHVSDGNRFTQTKELKVYTGGAEANVCILLSQLGMHANYITRLPDNDLSRLALNELHKYNVDTTSCVYGGERLGLYFMESGNQIRLSQVIYDRSNSSFSTIDEGDVDWNSVLEGTDLFHWSGISPGVSDKAGLMCKKAILAAHEKGIVISSDFNFRTKLWQYCKHPSEVMPELLYYSTIAIADLDSAELYFGIKTRVDAPHSDRFLKVYELLKQKMPYLKTLAMSFRNSDGVIQIYYGMLLHEENLYESKKAQLHFITDQIGSGDAFTAGLLYALNSGFSGQMTIDWAIACGALKQSIPGDFAIITPAEINHFINHNSSNRINR
ncbi:sugar kinase [Elizabethkingia meningoseptica]|uniref:sugar kinase n=1 Tax=Elizabethkingia meningoseptica TaxID=238 RepID=UPI0023AFFB0E|nr:sugar kinase [Elizabethkingia meningoseptica]MDE5437318.1 sugar kinase [Elizabethkingia meningoseptica]MDE5510419.1 sugar kinase [Elizabethkingia meningoseptica]MDE5514173.1 sugar kinase [Elizabethkingia meningoseptica]MDE5524821.1 sugar kinase [Elizabethkingia meningoseptica]MDE5528384.1 sugar kinase [Elizabethkingia meningoseptica]